MDTHNVYYYMITILSYILYYPYVYWYDPPAHIYLYMVCIVLNLLCIVTLDISIDFIPYLSSYIWELLFFWRCFDFVINIVPVLMLMNPIQSVFHFNIIIISNMIVIIMINIDIFIYSYTYIYMRIIHSQFVACA